MKHGDYNKKIFDLIDKGCLTTRIREIEVAYTNRATSIKGNEFYIMFRSILQDSNIKKLFDEPIKDWQEKQINIWATIIKGKKFDYIM
jgi:hypothetical protein